MPDAARYESTLDPTTRRRLGVHYTDERDVLRLLRSLCLDELRAALHAAGTDREQLLRLHDRLADLRLLDPACGDGGFLVLAHRELRLLEHDLLRALGERRTRINLHQFHGIELAAAPARLAELNLRASADAMDAHARAHHLDPAPPTAPQIHVGNALQLDWRALLPVDDHTLVLGNPPFAGKHHRSPEQRADLLRLAAGSPGAADLDYAAAWYLKAAAYVHGTRARLAFVATSSLTQGEQVPALWPTLLETYNLQICFAHRSFDWRRDAGVHVVIIGLAAPSPAHKPLHDHDLVAHVANISPYLTAGPDLVVRKSPRPLHDQPVMRCGNKPSDAGHLLLDPAELRALLAAEPGARPFVRRYLGSVEFLHRIDRWCLWLPAITPAQLDALPLIRRRVEAVRAFRLASTAAPTRRAADRPARFFFTSQPSTTYLAIPEVSSERRPYIPIDFLPPDVIASNKLYILPGRDLVRLGVLSSAMHMAWVRTISGRLRADYQYSATMVYNTFPWPQIDPPRHHALVTAVTAMQSARAAHPDATLADLYDPGTMPTRLADAHATLDRAVDRCYRAAPFTHDRDRLEHLLARHADATR